MTNAYVEIKCRNSAVGIAAGYGMDAQGVEFESG
jgi:hypothetical protein